MIEAIIFDLDGTIINTEDMWADATKQMLLARNISYTPELRKAIHDAVHGLPPIKACAVLKDMIGLADSAQDLAREKTQRARALFKGNIRFIEGFKEFHQSLKNTYKTAVATNCDMSFVALANQEVNLFSFFEKHLYGIDLVKNLSKPDPAIYLYAARQLGVDPTRCVAIEDSAAGIRAAKNAGMVCIGINTAHDAHNLRESDYIVNSYHEIKLAQLKTLRASRS